MPACETCAQVQGEKRGAYWVCDPCYHKHWGKVDDHHLLGARHTCDSCGVDTASRRSVDEDGQFAEWNENIGQFVPAWLCDDCYAEELREWRGLGWHELGSHEEDESWEDMLAVDEPGYALVEEGEDPQAWDSAAKAAEEFISKVSRTPGEECFLSALCVGHSYAEARRISGLTFGQAQHLLRRLSAT